MMLMAIINNSDIKSGNNHLYKKKFWNTEIESLSKEELFEKIEKPLLLSQLKFVLKNSKFYSKKYRAIGMKTSDLTPQFNFKELPFTEKIEIQKDQEENPPFGSILAVPIHKLRRIHRTSGSSGRPIFVALTQNDIDCILESGARSFWCAGLRPNDLIVHCLNYCLWMGGLTDHMCLEHTGATVIPYGVGNTRNLIEIIKYLHPTGISCTPSYLSKLELILRNEFKMTPKDLKLEKGFFGGELGIQNPDNRKIIEEKWGIEAIDANYGMADVLSIFGSECEFRKGLHFHGHGILHVELIDPNTGKNLEFKKGQIGELVYTNLKREGQPLIRFRSHDLAEIVGVGKCDCGRNGFRFKILGRSDNMLIVKGINVFPNAIADVLSKFLSFLTGEFEIILDTIPPYDFLKMRIEYRGIKTSESIESLKKHLQKALKELLEFKAEIEMIPEGKIVRTEGKAKRIKKMYL